MCVSVSLSASVSVNMSVSVSVSVCVCVCVCVCDCVSCWEAQSNAQMPAEKDSPVCVFAVTPFRHC